MFLIWAFTFLSWGFLVFELVLLLFAFYIKRGKKNGLLPQKLSGLGSRCCSTSCFLLVQKFFFIVIIIVTAFHDSLAFYLFLILHALIYPRVFLFYFILFFHYPLFAFYTPFLFFYIPPFSYHSYINDGVCGDFFLSVSAFALSA